MRYFITKQMSANKLETRMHSRGMRTARCIPYPVVSVGGTCVACQACPHHHICTPATHAPAMHASCHACPHACPPHMPPCMLPLPHTHPHHICPPPGMPPCHIPLPCMLPATHAYSPCMSPPRTQPLPRTPPPPVDRQTDTCKNITFANFVCGRYIANITLLFTQPMDSTRPVGMEQPRGGGPRTSA